MPKSSRKNIRWINYVKAHCIIGVYFVHCESYYVYELGIVDRFIRPFIVNAFFLISGYLLFRKQLSDSLLTQKCGEYVAGDGRAMLLNILYRLVIPTVLFSMIEFIPSYTLRGYSFDAGTFLYKTIGGCTYWFTAALVVAELLVLLLLLSRRKNVWFYFVGCCLFFAIGKCLVANNFSFAEKYPSLPWHLKNGLLAIIFMAFGGLYWRYENKINKIMNVYSLVGMIIIYILCVVCWPKTFHTSTAVLDVNIPGVALSLLATLILIELAKKIPSVRLLDYIGQNTIGIYFMSGALPIVLSMAVHRVLPGSSLLGLTIVFFGSCIIGLVAVYLMNRFAPWLFDLRLLKKTKSN